MFMKLSFVVPCYNEAENVALFQNAVIEAFDDCGYDYEIVFVDDGSQDATLHNLRKLYAVQACPVKVVSFSRNFGKEAALYAGLKHTCGEYISFIDADLQQRPEIVRDMVRTLETQPEYDILPHIRIVAAKERSSLSLRKHFIRLSTSFPIFSCGLMPAISVPSAAVLLTVLFLLGNITVFPRVSLPGSATTPVSSPTKPVRGLREKASGISGSFSIMPSTGLSAIPLSHYELLHSLADLLPLRPLFIWLLWFWKS